jgi:hypothetical protein
MVADLERFWNAIENATRNAPNQPHTNIDMYADDTTIHSSNKKGELCNVMLII